MDTHSESWKSFIDLVFILQRITLLQDLEFWTNLIGRKLKCSLAICRLF